MKEQKRPEAEINFKDIIKNPLRGFGLVYVLFATLILVIGIYWVVNLDAISLNKVPTKNVIDSTSVEKIKLKKGGLTPAVDLETVKEATPELVELGKETYTQVCASCHGDNGLGDGVAGAGLNPKPRNFTNADGWTNSTSITGMYKTLQEGIIQNGMTAYDYLPVKEKFALIHYIRTFADHFPEIKDEQIAELDQTYQLSKDVYVPHQIPVEMAINKISKENKLIIEKIKNELINDETAGALLIKKYFDNPVYSVYSFSINSSLKEMDDFIDAILRTPDSFGLKENPKSITENEWQLIFNYLNKFSSSRS